MKILVQKNDDVSMYNYIPIKYRVLNIKYID